MINFKMILPLFLMVWFVFNINAQIDPQNFPLWDPDNCSTVEDIAYILVNNKCNLYKNACLYGVEQRRRPQNNLKGKSISRKECRSKCIDICPEDPQRICAEYRGRSFNFDSICHMQRASCQQDKCYTFYYNGFCLTS